MWIDEEYYPGPDEDWEQEEYFNPLAIPFPVMTFSGPIAGTAVSKRPDGTFGPFRTGDTHLGTVTRTSNAGDTIEILLGPLTISDR